MKFKRKIFPDTKPNQNFITKKRLREDEIDFNKLRSYRLDRVKKELQKNNLEACILFDPVNIRYALDSNKIIKTLGWKPKVHFSDGIKLTFEWYNKNKSYYKNLSKKDIVKRLGQS